MKTSESIIKITPLFLNAQKAIESAKKDAENPYFKSKYADLNAVMLACKDILNENEIAVLQPVVGMTVETILIHTSGEFFSSETPIVCKSQNDPQALGSAITYARRYGLQSMVFISAEDDDAEKATSHTPVQKPVETYSRVSSEHFCTIHQRDLKLRDGDYYDHRLLIEGVWNRCEGEGFTTEQHKTEYEKKMESTPRQEFTINDEEEEALAKALLESE